MTMIKEGTHLEYAPVLHRFERDGDVIVYNAFTHKWIESDAGESIEDDSLRELAEIDWRLMSFKDLQTPHLMRVEVTQACNFKCSYCLVFQNDIKQLHTKMSLATAEKLVEYYHRNMVGGTLMLIGGEPTTNWPVVKYFFDNVSPEADKELYTNAVLLDEERMGYLAERRVSCRISLDGFERHHTRRLNAKGETEYEQILANIRRMLALGCDVGINCTVTQGNVDDLTDIHDFFVHDIGLKRVNYSIPHLAVHAAETMELDMDRYTDAMLYIYESAKANHLIVAQIIKRLAFLARKRFKLVGCTVVGPEVTFYPDGRETICTKLDGHHKTRNVSRSEIFEGLPYFQEDCRQCSAIGVCGGGCYWDAKMRFGRMQDLRECVFQRRLVERMIWDIRDWERTYPDNFPGCLNEVFGTRMFACMN